MKRCTILILLIIAFAGSSNSQDKKYFDSPFGFGGGFTPAWFFPGVEKLNEHVKSFGVPEIGTSGFYLSGGGGFVYLPIVRNLRIGGVGLGGSTSEKSLVNGYEHEIQYDNGFGGITVEYTLPLLKNIAVSVGAIIGSGETVIRISRTKGKLEWSGMWSELSDTSRSASSYSRELKNSYFSIVPVINIDIPFYRFLSFRIGGGYNLAIGNEWLDESGNEVINTPKEISGSGLFIQTGIMLGFFSY